jgi:DNA-binding transcriptional LysR family regulator
MRIRRVIDSAFAESGVTVTPQVETDSVASLYAQVGVGAWPSSVPHTWLRAMPVDGHARAIQLVEPNMRAQFSVATHAATSGSVVARAFVTTAQGLSLDEFFDQTLPIESLVN